ncbi:MAG: DUF2231 domain-containing protein [Sphingomicrobium sp.]
MADTVEHRRPLDPIHPVHAVLVSSALTLFLGALLSDWAYSTSYQVQWTNFASWLIAAALLFVGFALLWAIIDSLRADTGEKRHKWIHVGLLVATFVIGLINALVHSRDAWAAMPAGLILSIICVLLALAAVWTAFSSHRIGASR